MADFPPDFPEQFDEPPVDVAGPSPVVGPPHSRSAEEAVLASVLINPESYYDLVQVLQTDDFFIRRNGMIWEGFVQLTEQKTPIDLLTITDYLERNNLLQDVGGLPYLTELVSNLTTSLNATHYANIIKNNAIRRRMITSANLLATLAFDKEKQIDEILDEAEKSVFNLSENRIQRDLTPLNHILGNVYDQVESLANRDADITGVPTGMNMIDKFMGGLQKSDLLILAGRPGMGKTGWMLTVAKNAAVIHKKTVAYFSLEMANEQLAQRMLAQVTGIDMKKIRMGALNDDDWAKFFYAINDMTNARLFIDDTPAITPMQLLAKCRRLDTEYDLDLVVIDYLQLMGSGRRSENRVQEVSYISRTLKMLARELDVPVLAGAQLSRAVEQRADKRPILSDLRESGSLEQDADIVMFIHRQGMDDDSDARKDIAELIIAKHRNGPTHSGIKMIFKAHSASFEDYPMEQVEYR
jgi:replicative DNA helicase